MSELKSQLSLPDGKIMQNAECKIIGANADCRTSHHRKRRSPLRLKQEGIASQVYVIGNLTSLLSFDKNFTTTNVA